MSGSTGEIAYLNLLKEVMENGVDRPDRTGTGTRSLFGKQLRFDLNDGFPLLTTKTVGFKMVSSELLWFIEGSTDERRLAEIRYGQPRSELGQRRTIWTDNSEADYWRDKAKFYGDMGRIYGQQWRKWEKPAETLLDKVKALFGKTNHVDQIATLVSGLVNDPYGRRHILINYNPGEVHRQALPACHVMANFYVNDGRLSCMFTMRSNDLFLGLPANIASYALLTHMLAQVTGLKVGELVYSGADCHIYSNHFDAVNEQLSRTPTSLPTLEIDDTITDIDGFTMDSFRVNGYLPQESIKAKMAV